MRGEWNKDVPLGVRDSSEDLEERRSTGRSSLPSAIGLVIKEAKLVENWIEKTKTNMSDS